MQIRVCVPMYVYAYVSMCHRLLHTFHYAKSLFRYSFCINIFPVSKVSSVTTFHLIIFNSVCILQCLRI